MHLCERMFFLTTSNALNSCLQYMGILQYSQLKRKILKGQEAAARRDACVIKFVKRALAWYITLEQKNRYCSRENRCDIVQLRYVDLKRAEDGFYVMASYGPTNSCGLSLCGAKTTQLPHIMLLVHTPHLQRARVMKHAGSRETYLDQRWLTAHNCSFK